MAQGRDGQFRVEAIGDTMSKYVIVRCSGAGVHAGELVSKTDTTVTLANSRRLWAWSGAASLSEIAVYGAKNSDKCRFAVAVPEIELSGWHEIIVCRPEGEKMIRECCKWEQ